MINFDTILDTPVLEEVEITVPVVATAVSVTPVSVPPSAVSWEEVRDYAIEQITRTSGPIPRNSKSENTIFRSFVDRWGALAMPITRHVFEQCDGLWMNAPVGVHRFHKTSDAYFAQRVAQQLAH